MAWKATGKPTVQKQRDRFVVRVHGIDTQTGKRRPRQLGSYSSKRAAQTAAVEFTAARDVVSDRRTVGELVESWAASRVHVGKQARHQYEWAARHISRALGGIRIDQLERTDIARWLDQLASGGKHSRRTIVFFRMVLRAVLSEAVEDGLITRSPAARIGVPKRVVGKGHQRDVDAWTEPQMHAFLAVSNEHRWAGPIRLELLYGLRRSELLGLHWSAVDLKAGTVRIECGLVQAAGQIDWSDGKNQRSRRTIPIDAGTVRALAAHRRLQNEERLAVGPDWIETGLVVTTRNGNYVHPNNFDDTLERLIKKAGVPRITSHGLRHTAATQMVRHAADIGEVRAAAEVLGHSPDMLLRTYAHALPESVRSLTDKIGQRAAGI